MSIKDEMSKIDEQEQRDLNAWIKEATPLFNKHQDKKEKIRSLLETDAMKSLLAFFEEKKATYESSFRQETTPEVVGRLQGRYDVVCEFLDMIDTLRGSS